VRVLITGATGFIGRRLCNVLAEAGHELVALSRNPDAATRMVPELHSALECHPLQAAPDTAAFSGTEAIVHLAGESVVGRWTGSKKRAILDSRIISTNHLVEAVAAVRERPKILIAASAIGYYGDRGDEILDEQSQPGSDFLADVCRRWESAARAAVELGLRVVHLRIGVVLGRGGGALKAMLLPFKMGFGGPLGSGLQWWSWVHRDDVAGMILRALEDGGIAGPLNATSPDPIRQRRFAKVLGKVLRRPAFVPTPDFALKAVLGGFSSELLSSKRVVPAKLQEAGFRFRFPDLGAALSNCLQ